MSYIIRSFDANFGRIDVEFSNNAGTAKQTFSIDLPVTNGLYPVGDELVAYINSFAPTAAFERVSLVSAASNAAAIQALVVPIPVPEATTPAVDGSLPGGV